MKFTSFFRVAKHQRFQYEPRYYDPVKEELNIRVSRLKKKGKGSSHSVHFKKEFRKKLSKSKQSETRRRVIQLLLVFIFLLFTGYLLGFIKMGFVFLLLIILPLIGILRFSRKV